MGVKFGGCGTSRASTASRTMPTKTRFRVFIGALLLVNLSPVAWLVRAAVRLWLVGSGGSLVQRRIDKVAKSAACATPVGSAGFSDSTGSHVAKIFATDFVLQANRCAPSFHSRMSACHRSASAALLAKSAMYSHLRCKMLPYRSTWFIHEPCTGG